MGSSFFRRRSPLPMGWQYELPEGKVATPAQSAEYRRRKRRVGFHAFLIFLLAPGAIWIGVTFIHGEVLYFCYFLAVAVALTALLILTASGFRCPVCEKWMGRQGSTSLTDLSPERRAAIYGRYRWCDGCGTRFEIYPNATFPSEGTSAHRKGAPNKT